MISNYPIGQAYTQLGLDNLNVAGQEVHLDGSDSVHYLHAELELVHDLHSLLELCV